MEAQYANVQGVIVVILILLGLEFLDNDKRSFASIRGWFDGKYVRPFGIFHGPVVVESRRLGRFSTSERDRRAVGG
jgi:hypothetical protein